MRQFIQHVGWWTWLLCGCFILGLAGFSTPIHAQNLTEICDNGQDDDGDGRIDLNDPECDSGPMETPSLIPNPSFEDTLCCPQSRSQMLCADTWIQASEPTTDYLHTCGWLGWEGLPVPLPIPDGDACVGFRNGAFDQTLRLPNWKEYTGACLLEPLQPGVLYKFQFYLGFVNSVFSPPLDITFFGTEDCVNLPFGVGNEALGCPTNGPGWFKLGTTRVSGSGEWVQVEINAVPDRKIEAIAIGPDCLQYISTRSIYYFLDDLTLNTATSFGLEIEASDQLCAEEVYLSVPALSDIQYQWYKDGVALVGETSHILSNIPGRGRYQVVSTRSDGNCSISDEFAFLPPVVYQTLDTTICQGQAYWFGGAARDQEGSYIDTLKTADNCDSVLTLNLDLFVNEPTVSEVKIWPGEQVILGPARLSEPGRHEVEMVSRSGCDSTAIIDLKFLQFFAPTAFSPNDDGVNDRYYIQGGTDILAINDLRIFNRWGRQVFQGTGQDSASGWDGLVNGSPAPEGVYVFKAQAIFVDGNMREHTGSITLLR